MKWKLQEDHKGFTLIELLVSVAILAFVVAPFLGSFVAAGESNIKAKRKQEATDLGQLLAEEFMVKKFDKLEIDYGKPDEENISATPSDGKRYTFKIENTKIPADYAHVGYRAEVILEPSKHAVVNDATITPQVNEAHGDNMAVIMSKFFEKDADAASKGARYRTSTITVSNAADKEQFLITITVDYFDAGGQLIADVSSDPVADERITRLYYAKLPSIYLMYLPFSENDEIVINNELTEDEQGNKHLEVYLSKQKLNNGTDKDISSDNVKILDNGLSTKLTELNAPDSGVAPHFKTKVHSNVTGNLVPLINEKSLYDMTINIYVGGKQVSSLKTTKIVTD